MKLENAPHFTPNDESEWRVWLEKNHLIEESVWVVFYRKASPQHNLTWGQAVDQALCFGWIDSIKRPIDGEKFKQYFSKRKKGGTWSKINKDKVRELKKQGLMHPMGEASISQAKKDGSWTFLDPVDRLEIPDDLNLAFERHPKAKNHYDQLSVGKKKLVLYWLLTAKRLETRTKRINELIQKGEIGELPTYFQ